MFEEFNGLPLHALVVHAPVVLVPLLVLAALAYALVPKIRGQVWWATALLAVIAPLSVLLAKLSGDAFVALAFSPDPPEAVRDHRDFGNALAFFAGVLGLLTLALVWAGGRGARPRTKPWVAVVLAVLVVVAAVISAFYVVRVGDSGAQMIWHNRLPS